MHVRKEKVFLRGIIDELECFRLTCVTPQSCEKMKCADDLKIKYEVENVVKDINKRLKELLKNTRM